MAFLVGFVAEPEHEEADGNDEAGDNHQECVLDTANFVTRSFSSGLCGRL